MNSDVDISIQASPMRSPPPRGAARVIATGNYLVRASSSVLRSACAASPTATTPRRTTLLLPRAAQRRVPVCSTPRCDGRMIRRWRSPRASHRHPSIVISGLMLAALGQHDAERFRGDFASRRTARRNRPSGITAAARLNGLDLKVMFHHRRDASVQARQCRRGIADAAREEGVRRCNCWIRHCARKLQNFAVRSYCFARACQGFPRRRRVDLRRNNRGRLYLSLPPAGKVGYKKEWREKGGRRGGGG